ncbi:hydrogenase maturation nickel metallochaperone HypA [Maledivibacter halophilus]|uniref:Hydrogenase maturation factor HypA n=1 Tax=Maledivibacter halophilus TaxID=36842 RepID=A0A1T5L9G1_9FIRM|nr:hydrogenase maturation nickel metallochaperone HypA [Maledivibacter halophilus]SKC72621.1 hydrogenase nickel incorporation protein HypA/HybF [Maledivibacter halophilus]
MHEVAVAQEILKIVNQTAEKYDLHKVNKIRLKIGEFTCIEESALSFAFTAVAKETICEDSKIVIERVRARAYCKYCKENFFISYTNKLCPKCNNESTDISTGYELLLDRIEGE